MDSPLEIAFHNLQPSPAIETELRKHVDKLEHRFGRLTGCRVSVEKLHNQHRTGNLFEIHITLSIPGHGRDSQFRGRPNARRSASPTRTSMSQSAMPSMPRNVSLRHSKGASAPTQRHPAPPPSLVRWR